MVELNKKEKALFDILEAAAVAGERCPTNPELRDLVGSPTTSDLARKGFITVEVYALNWRVVTIIHGAHAGKCTKRSPHKGAKKPYKTINRFGTFGYDGKPMAEPVRSSPEARVLAVSQVAKLPDYSGGC